MHVVTLIVMMIECTDTCVHACRSIAQVQEIERTNLLAEKNAQETEDKENEARQIERELHAASIRVSAVGVLLQGIEGDVCVCVDR